MWEGHLLPTPLNTQYLTAKHKYLETKLVNILIEKEFRCRNTVYYTQQTTFFSKKPVFFSLFDEI